MDHSSVITSRAPRKVAPNIDVPARHSLSRNSEL
jgi:hypothetical protein